MQPTEPTPSMDSENGAPIGRLDARYDLIPGDGLERAAVVMAEGLAAHGRETWRKISRDSHLNHALAHIYKHTSGDRNEDHLGHALCRIMFANSILTEQDQYIIEKVLGTPRPEPLLGEAHKAANHTVQCTEPMVALGRKLREAVNQVNGVMAGIGKVRPILDPPHKSIRAYICAPLRPFAMTVPYPTKVVIPMDMAINPWVAKSIASFLFRANPDIYPIIPHVQFPYVDDFDPAQRSAVMNHCEDTVALSDVVLQLVYCHRDSESDMGVEYDYVSEGMQAELAKAEEEGVPIVKCLVYLDEYRTIRENPRYFEILLYDKSAPDGRSETMNIDTRCINGSVKPVKEGKHAQFQLTVNSADIVADILAEGIVDATKRV